MLMEAYTQKHKLLKVIQSKNIVLWTRYNRYVVYKNPSIVIDLTESDFRNLNLSWIEFINVDFSMSNFKHCLLPKSKLYNCKFVKCKFNYINMEVSNIKKSDFSHSELSLVSLRSVSINNSLFMNAVLDDCVFENGLLRNVSFNKALFKYVSFDDAELINVELSNGHNFPSLSSFKNTKIDDMMLSNIIQMFRGLDSSDQQIKNKLNFIKNKIGHLNHSFDLSKPMITLMNEMWSDAESILKDSVESITVNTKNGKMFTYDGNKDNKIKVTNRNNVVCIPIEQIFKEVYDYMGMPNKFYIEDFSDNFCYKNVNLNHMLSVLNEIDIIKIYTVENKGCFEESGVWNKYIEYDDIRSYDYNLIIKILDNSDNIDISVFPDDLMFFGQDQTSFYYFHIDNSGAVISNNRFGRVDKNRFENMIEFMYKVLNSCSHEGKIKDMKYTIRKKRTFFK